MLDTTENRRHILHFQIDIIYVEISAD
jgi:hypothetical protein